MDENLPLRERFAEVFARLPEQAIEQFYAQYQLWLLRRRVPILQKQIEAIDEHFVENQQVMRSLQPSAIALAVLARLQANGVSNIELLDLLLSRGEDWLDRMMQRLDYCEQVRDFIQGDYTQWCYRSLDGAYDWIDTLLGSVNGDEEPRQAVEEDSGATEELLLRKLRLDDEDEMLEATFTPPVVSGTENDEAAVPSAETGMPSEPVEEFPQAEAVDGPPGEEQMVSEQLPELTAWTDLDTSGTISSASVEASLQVSSSDEQSGEGQRVSEQPPELVGWADLDAPGERPAPWYGVSLAPDGSAEPGQQAEMNEWVSLLQEEEALQTGTNTIAVAVDGVDISGVAEQAEGAEIVGAAREVEKSSGGDEILLSREDIAREDSAVLGEVAHTIDVSHTSTEESEGEPGSGTKEAGQTLPLDDETQENIDIVPLVEHSKAEEEDRLIQPADQGAPEPREFAFEIDNEPEGTAGQTEAGEDTETEVLLVEEKSEPLEREEAPGEREMLPEAHADEMLDNDIADPQEEQRPWYEYLNLHQTISPAQPAIGERVEPEAPSLVALDAPLQEEAGRNGRVAEDREEEPTEDPAQADEATQPIMLRDVQRAREQASAGKNARMAHGVSGSVHLSTGNAGLPGSNGACGSTQPEREAQGEVHAFLGLVVSRTSLSELPQQGGAGELQREETGGSASLRRVQQTASWPQNEETPQKRGIWQRLFGWLRRKRAQS
jgi:hypothetical protein